MSIQHLASEVQVLIAALGRGLPVRSPDECEVGHRFPAHDFNLTQHRPLQLFLRTEITKAERWISSKRNARLP